MVVLRVLMRKHHHHVLLPLFLLLFLFLSPFTSHSIIHTHTHARTHTHTHTHTRSRLLGFTLTPPLISFRVDRYLHDLIYTNVGDILIAVNPFRDITNLYGCVPNVLGFDAGWR